MRVPVRVFFRLFMFSVGFWTYGVWFSLLFLGGWVVFVLNAFVCPVRRPFGRFYLHGVMFAVTGSVYPESQGDRSVGHRVVHRV